MSIGSRSLLNEVELVEIVERVFRKALGIRRGAQDEQPQDPVTASPKPIGHADKMMDITIAIDKLEKIGTGQREGRTDASAAWIGEAVDKLQPILELSGDNRTEAQPRCAKC